jgi:hypothetical protein
MVLAFFLLYTVLMTNRVFFLPTWSQAAQAPPGLSMATDIGLLITIILCVSISFWLTFTGIEAKDWTKGALLFAGLICGSVMFGYLTLAFTFGAAAYQPRYEYSAAFEKVSMAGFFLFVITIILAVAAFLALILILDSYLIAEARGRLQESR